MRELHDMIDVLIDKYKDNDYIFNRLKNTILTQLPNALTNAEILYEQRNDRKAMLISNGDKFIEDFLNENRYYYCARMELFIYYDGHHYKPICEDNILHHILITLTKQPELRVWKYRIKNALIKSIKERSPLHTIPDTTTVQTILEQLYPNVFYTREASLHFLIAVGDCIHGKKCNTYIVPSSLKIFIREIENKYYNVFGQSNLLTNFKLKYYAHEYVDTRLFHCILHSPYTLQDVHILDLLCVSSYYSLQYNNADDFVNQTNDKTLYGHVYFLKDMNYFTLARHFKEKALYVSEGSLVKSKTMILILRQFLKEMNIPNIIFQETFAIEMKKLLSYDEATDNYKDVTSNYIPIVSSFCSFWDEHMIEDYTAPDLEIEDVIDMFFKHTSHKFTKSLTSELVVDILKHHMCSDVIIEQNKYIHNIRYNFPSEPTT